MWPPYFGRIEYPAASWGHRKVRCRGIDFRKGYGGGAFWVKSANRENSIHVIIVRFREIVVIQSEVKMRWNRVLTWGTVPFPIPVPFGNLGDGVGGGR